MQSTYIVFKQKNGTRGGGRASKKKNPRLRRLQSQEQDRNLHLNRHKSERVSFRSPQGEEPKKQAMPTAVRQETGERRKQCARKAHRNRPSRPRKPTAPNHAVGQRKGEWKLQIPPRWAALGKKNALLILNAMEKWFYFWQPTNLAFYDLTIGKVAPKALKSLLGIGVNFCPTPSPPHAQHRQEHGAFWEGPAYLERLRRQWGSYTSC